ncbi:uncharacterized protein LOC106055860 isoform X1 [Biomphalaria glabrata]|uniref:Uncharacterized protein LOC106055860 isoform X1 n=1 Tax=Biomphalaria glabrata TaxID=6526 RepID=A0A9W2YHV5_BIOGL|nr:uncharacterized protein LOC106055860 isoform X1 [Biomphalaria glabrata]
MTNLETSISIDIFDDPAEMELTFCQQISEHQYQEEIRTETDKALGELCFYLDKNPEVYARILRKRKQDEIEDSGMFSFLKSKMMSMLQGEHYQEQLISDSECLKQAQALKAGMCKAFQYSEELKGNPTSTRHSERLALKRQAWSAVNESLDSPRKRRRLTPKKKKFAEGSTNTTPRVSRNKSPEGKVLSEHSNAQPDISENNVANSDSSDAPNCVAAPPPPPPLPAHMMDCVVSCENIKANNNTTKTSINDLVQEFPLMSRSKRRMSNSESIESPNEEFVTPTESTSIPRRNRRHRSSSSSTPKSSIKNFHSELLSFNPVERLKATPVNRSPGLTPLRVKADFLPSEPLQKALHIAMKHKFKNVNTPSPKSDGSFNSVYSSP